MFNIHLNNIAFDTQTSLGFKVSILGVAIRDSTPDHLGIAIVQDKLVQFTADYSDMSKPSITYQIVGEPIHFDDIFPKTKIEVENAQEDEDSSKSTT